MQVKAAELASVQRLEAAELRKQEEKTRRLEQARARASAETHLREKVAAATFARGYIKGKPALPSLQNTPIICTIYFIHAMVCSGIICSHDQT